MRLKKSKTPNSTTPILWKAAQDCSESELVLLASGVLAPELGPKDWVLLDGELGAGKSTFARAVLAALRAGRGGKPAEGSPTFSLVHEYKSSAGGAIFHVDLYRLDSFTEVEDSGVLSLFAESQGLILIEWASKFEEFYDSLVKTSPPKGVRVFQVRIEEASAPNQRNVSIFVAN